MILLYLNLYYVILMVGLISWFFKKFFFLEKFSLKIFIKNFEIIFCYWISIFCRFCFFAVMRVWLPNIALKHHRPPRPHSANGLHALPKFVVPVAWPYATWQLDRVYKMLQPFFWSLKTFFFFLSSITQYYIIKFLFVNKFLFKVFFLITSLFFFNSFNDDSIFVCLNLFLVHVKFLYFYEIFYWFLWIFLLRNTTLLFVCLYRTDLNLWNRAPFIPPILSVV